MPLIFKKEIGEDTVAIWHILENEVHLFESKLLISEKTEAFSVSNTAIRNQKLGARYLIDQLLQSPVEITYDSYGKPIMKGYQQELSMTHSKERVGVMLSDKNAGLDLQVIQDKIERIIPRFMSDEEQAYLDEKYRIEHAHVLWCAKEALYKVYSRKELIFREQLLITPFVYSNGGGVVEGRIVLGEEIQKYRLQYEKLDNYMLVYVLND